MPKMVISLRFSLPGEEKTIEFNVDGTTRFLNDVLEIAEMEEEAPATLVQSFWDHLEVSTALVATGELPPHAMLMWRKTLQISKKKHGDIHCVYCAVCGVHSHVTGDYPENGVWVCYKCIPEEVAP